MAGTSFFSDMVQSITDRGRKLLFAQRAHDDLARSNIEDLCEMLLSSRGEASGMALAAEILERWSRLDEAGIEAFLWMLFKRFGPDDDALDEAIESYRTSRTPASLIRLQETAEPRRQELVRRLNLAPGGTAALVRMRERLLRLKTGAEELRAVDADFAHLFGSWFNRGFLTLRRIDWSTQADILEKIIRYEAVHAIANWDELRRRLVPVDRRCFAFFHPRLEDDPLVFVEVALTRSVPATIAEVLDERRATIGAEQATTAVFYSISNCQDGLRGISFGNFLIKQVVEDLRRDLPNLKTFVTLSPVPGLARWLERELADKKAPIAKEDRLALGMLEDPRWPDDAEKAATVRAALLPQAARYFLVARTPDKRPQDAVARFHLGNGARLDRINFLADRSPRAMAQAFGIMVNYRYELDDIIANHEALVQRGEVVAAPAIHQLLKSQGSSSGKASAASSRT